MATSGWDAARIVAVATVVVAIANLLFLWINAQATRGFEEKTQRTARNQARIEGAYRDFVTLMHRITVWVDYNVNQNAATGKIEPDPVSDREVSEVVAQLRTFGSDAVVAAADEWSERFSMILVAMSRSPTRQGHDLGYLQAHVATLRDRERVVRGLIRNELTA